MSTSKISEFDKKFKRTTVVLNKQHLKLLTLKAKEEERSISSILRRILNEAFGGGSNGNNKSR